MENYMKWIDDGFKIGIHDDDMPVYKCPFCNKRTFVLPFGKSNNANFCPNCGEDLREDKE